MLRKKDDAVMFGGVDLNTVEGIQITSIQPHRLQNREVTSSSLASTDGAATSAAFYGGRNINIEAIIAQPSREMLDVSLGTLRKIVQRMNQTMVIPIEDEYRDLFNVTMTNFVTSDMKGGYCAVDIEFLAEDPFSYDLLTTEALNALNLTSSDRTYPVVFEGTADQAPVITIHIDSLTVTSAGTITVTNPATGFEISVTEVFVANDTIVIDCKDKTVTLNSAPHDFDGNFITFDSADHYFRYYDNFTARQVDINVVYTKRYL